jgi:hypothetical protein
MVRVVDDKGRSNARALTVRLVPPHRPTRA